VDDHQGGVVTLLEGSAEAVIDAPIARCWEVVAEIDRSAEWQQGTESVDVLQRDAEGRPSLCEIVVDAKFKKLRLRAKVSYEPPHRLAFSKAESGSVEQLEGSWELTELDPGRTRARYALAVDPGKVGLMARPLERALRPIVVGQRPSELAAEVARRAAG
jgi:uncharacterized protein YndB with AHSA1/START domain